MRRVTVATAVVLATLVATASPALAKSYSLDRLTVDATVRPDASMDVTEHITYDFHGSFHRATRAIPSGATYEIRDVQVSENGRPLPVEGPPNDFAWTFSASDETRTFDIHYLVVGAVAVGPDVGELYWKFVGTDHPGIGDMTVEIATPAAEGGVRAWAHGPLNGVVSIHAGNVTLAVHPVPAATFVEARVAMPAAAFTVPPVGGPRLPRILSEEQANAQQANAQRAADEQRARDRDRNARRFGAVPLVVALLGWAAFALLWRRWGREPRPADEVGEYWHDVPKEPPAVADGILDFGGVEPVAFAATVVDLAQRGYLEISEEHHDRMLLPDKVDWTFRKKKDADRELQPFERHVLDRLFADGPETTQDDIVHWAKEHPTAAKEFWDDFKSDVGDAVYGTYVQKGRAGVKGLNVVAAVVVIGVGILALSIVMDAPHLPIWAVVLAAVAIASGAVQAFASRTLSCRTDLGAQRAAELEGLRRYLNDFSQLKDAPVGHLILWERYLVYAVALGVSHELVKGLALRAPEVVNDPHFAVWYGGWALSNGAPRFDSLSTFASGFAAATSAAFTPPSSGSGFGGGFSGGGGGGGGGGGFGAS